MGWRRHHQGRSDDTPVRILDEEVTTDQTRWHNRYWIDSEGQIRQSEQYLGAHYFPVKTTLIKGGKHDQTSRYGAAVEPERSVCFCCGQR